MVKFDDDPVRPSASYSVLGKHAALIFIFIAVFLLAFALNGIAWLIKGKLLDGLLPICVSTVFLISIAMGWSKERGRVTTIAIADGKVLIKELKFDVIEVQKEIAVDQIESVYIKRLFGRFRGHAGYEVRAKLHSQNDFPILNLQLLREAKDLRQFLSVHLHVPESWAPSNVLTSPY